MARMISIVALIISCCLIHAQKIAKDTEDAQRLALVPIGPGRRLLAAQGVDGAGWFTRWLSELAMGKVFGDTNMAAVNGNAITIKGILQLSYDKVSRLIQVLFVAVKGCAKLQAKKKAWQYLSAGLAKTSGNERRRNILLASSTLKFIWQAGFTIDVFATIRNAAIWAVNKVRAAVAELAQKIKNVVAEIARQAESLFNQLVDALSRTMHGLKEQLAGFLQYWGFEPWGTEDEEEYAHCKLDGVGTEAPCVCDFVDGAGEEVAYTNPATGKQEKIKLPSDVLVCMSGETCMASRSSGGRKYCVMHPEISTCTNGNSGSALEREPDNGKLENLKNILRALVKHFTVNAPSGTVPEEEERLSNGVSPGPHRRLLMQAMANGVQGLATRVSDAILEWLGRKLWENILPLMGLSASAPSSGRTAGTKIKDFAKNMVPGRGRPGGVEAKLASGAPSAANNIENQSKHVWLWKPHVLAFEVLLSALMLRGLWHTQRKSDSFNAEYALLE